MYSPLFDALGTSAYFYNQPFIDFNGNGVNDGGDEDDAARPNYDWSGMTDVENYGSFHGKLYLVVQPAKYVKFRVGGEFGYETDHFITKTDKCRPENQVWDGEATVCSRYNFDHRPEIDNPGNRFFVHDTFLWRVLVDVTAMF